MKTLDDLLAERAAADYQEKLGELLNPDLWTNETRDERMTDIRKLAMEMGDRSQEFVQQMLDTQFEGKSLLYWKVLQQFIAAEIEMLHNFRNDLDVTSPEALADIPVDYNWVNEGIKSRYQEIGDLATKLDALTSLTTVEEL
jgi:hypothetical protein